jgi:hypothetical protein
MPPRGARREFEKSGRFSRASARVDPGKAAARGRAELPMRIKVREGTPLHAETSLCTTCRHSRITRGRKLDEEIVYCSASHIQAAQITFKVMSCSAYSSRTEPTYYELMQQAWILQPGSRRRPSGFVRASDLRDEELARCMSEARFHGEP